MSTVPLVPEVRDAGAWTPTRRLPQAPGAYSMRRDLGGLALVSLLMILYPFEHGAGDSKFSLVDAIVVIVAVVQAYRASRRPLPLPRYTPYAIALAVVALASTTVNIVDLEPYFSGTRDALIETSRLVMATLWMCAIYWLLSPRFAQRFVQLAATSTLFAFGTALGAITLMVTEGLDARPHGPFENANLFGAYLCLNAFLALAAHGVLREYADREHQPLPATFRALRPLFLPVILPVLLLGIVATGSRGALVGTLGGLALSGYLRPRGLRVRHVVFAMALLTVLAGGLRWSVREGPPVVERTVRTLTGGSQGAEERLMLWEAAAEAFVTHPILGVGYGQFPHYAHLTTGESKAAQQTYLTIAAELGVIGIAVFAWLVVAVLRDSLRSRGRAYASVAMAGRGYILAVLIQGLVADVHLSWATWICIGIIAAHSAPVYRRPSRPWLEDGLLPGVWRQ